MEYKYHLRLQYPGNLSITTDGEMKIFLDKTKFKQNQPYKGKLQHKQGINTQNHKINLTTNPKEECHTNIIPTLTTKITGNSNYWSLISLNINGLNSPIKKT